MQVNPFVLDGSPQPFDEDIIPPGAATVHAELATLALHGIDKGLGGKLAALVGIDDLGPAVALESLLQHVHGMTGFQGDRDFGGQDFARGPVNHRCQIRKAFGQWDVRRIQGPNLIGAVRMVMPRSK